jgi:cytochrome c
MSNNYKPFNNSTMIKKMFAAAALPLFLIACGGNETKKEEKPAGTEETVSSDLSNNPDYKKGLALVSASDCLTCHKINEKINGPAYADVAAKYSNAADTTIARLAQTIIKGGAGNWGTVRMTPHPALSEADAIQMVKYVLLLKK